MTTENAPVDVLGLMDKSANPAHWAEARAAIESLINAARSVHGSIVEADEYGHCSLSRREQRIVLEAALARIGGAL